MYNILGWIAANQVPCILIGFLLGTFLALIIAWKLSSVTAWRIADLAWVTVGGFSTFFAVLASIFLSNVDDLSRQIDAAKSELFRLNRNTGVFVERWCNSQRFSISLPVITEHLMLVCRDAEILKDESSTHTTLATFIDWFQEQRENKNRSSMQVEKFDGLKPGLEFQEIDWSKAEFGTSKAAYEMMDALELRGLFAFQLPMKDVLQSASVLIDAGLYEEAGYEYVSIRQDFENLKLKFAELQLSWYENEKGRKFLLTRTLALFFLAMVFPLRVGKSYFEISQLRIT
ncbi:hypothetical protein EF888_16295 [Silicimonas algicola]|uniref:Uncharacterized protein n=1 Tax=Silicimonas algicola TaxID=1826607 RepID=A0A316G474_9RHOB|nr:hypothetical protein [Silicimonas algicola]AZQ68555.1 hypothetical protein EF888_16295 [Silicimonas algicola]PWK55731.1 hypothetical protein C8D95_106127 [Silicimonas algicola]